MTDMLEKQRLKKAPTKESPSAVATVPPLLSEPLTVQQATDLQARLAAMQDSAFASLHELVVQESQRRKRQREAGKENDLLRAVLQQLAPAPPPPPPEKPVKPTRRKPR